jgi:branched-chain amino acid transport system substrate-binding protein
MKREPFRTRGGVASGLALLTLAMLVALLAAGTGKSADKAPVKIGLTVALTGAGAATDNSYRAGVSAAVAYVNAHGGVLGGRKLEVVTRDTGTSATGAAASIRELAGMKDITFFILDPISFLALAQGSTVIQDGRPAVSFSAADLVDPNSNSGIYYFGESSQQTADEILYYMVKTRKFQKIGILYENNAFGAGMNTTVQGGVKALSGVTLVGNEGFQSGSTTVAAQLQKLRGAGAQALILATYGPGLATTVRGLQEINWHPPSVTTPGVALPVISKAVGGASNLPNIYGYGVARAILVNKAKNQPSHEGQNYLNALPRSWKSDLVQPAWSYDAILTMAKAINLAKSTDSAAIKKALESRKWDGIRTDYRFTAPNHRGVDISTAAFFRADSVCTKKNGCLAAPGVKVPTSTKKK